MSPEQQLLPLWKQAFGEYDGFWELFLETGFSRERCLYLEEEGRITAALCWFDCCYENQKWAYLYAVVTHPAHRGKGLCRKLMDRAHGRLEALGYAGVLLVPADEGLRNMYGKMGYETCTRIGEFSCEADGNPVRVKALSVREYAPLRRLFLPNGGVIQEDENLRFLSAQVELVTGDGFLAALYREENTLRCMEFLGDTAKTPGIVSALDCTTGHFRTPGADKPWAMGKRLREDAIFPAYFGFAFD